MIPRHKKPVQASRENRKEKGKRHTPKESTITLFNGIIEDIAEKHLSVSDAIKGKMSFSTFYEILKDEEKSKKYARACELRAEYLFDEMIEIADEKARDVTINEETGRPMVDNEVIQRSRLRVDTRKWALSKINPKKYGDKLQLDQNITDSMKQIKSLFPTKDQLEQATN